MNISLKKITSGDAEVLLSGTVISYDDQPISIEFGPSDVTLKISLGFDVDDTNNVRATAKQINEKEIKLTFYNAKDSKFGSGVFRPIPIGELNGKNIFFSFRLYTLEGSDQRTVHYTIYEKN